MKFWIFCWILSKTIPVGCCFLPTSPVIWKRWLIILLLFHKGKVYFSEPKDLLLEKYGVLKCTESEFSALDGSVIKGVRRHQFGLEALVERQKLSGRYTVDKASIEDIMLFIARGEHR